MAVVNNLRTWSKRDVITLRAAARRGERISAVGKRLGRSRAAVSQKAMRCGFSFKPR
jgi:hypothetical protein